MKKDGLYRRMFSIPHLNAEITAMFQSIHPADAIYIKKKIKNPRSLG